MIGKTVSHYRIIEKLGEGGMGVVYKAEDTKLGRTLAIKFLPPELTRDKKAKQRFIQEARAASALDHSNICTIFEIDETEEGRMFICMACYQGKTLKEKIAEGPLDLIEAVDIAMQVAQGLAKAHAQGIVHRDIKPGNIFITNDCQAKIVDFGLAKLAGQLKLTSTGKMMGTVAYMSPEQERGEEVGPKADIWSLGVVLYEMVTGELPFKGDYDVAVMYSIMNEEPAPMHSLRREMPMELEGIVRKALAKNQAQRYQDADEILADLSALKRQFDFKEFTASHEWKFKAKERRLSVTLGAVAAVVVAAVIIWWLWLDKAGQSAMPEGQPHQVTSGDVWEGEPALSPDGGRIAFASDVSGNRDIYIVDVQGRNRIQLTADPAPDYYPTWFPDGTALAFVSERGGEMGIWKIGQLGGGATLLLQGAADPAISPDGERIAFSIPGPGGYFRIGVAPLADPAKVTMLTGDTDGIWDHRSPAWSPDGKTICYSTQHDLWIIPSSGGPTRRLSRDGKPDSHPAWSSDGRYVYFSSQREGTLALWRIAAGGGIPRRLTMGSGYEHDPSICKDGTRLAYASQTARRTLFVRDLRSGKETKLPGQWDDHMAAMAPDGGKIVFSSDRGGEDLDLWVQPLEWGVPSGQPQRLTEEPGHASHPVFSPDGKWLAYYRVIGEQRDIYTIPVSGGQPIQFTDDPAADFHPAWSPDGSMLAFVSERGGGSRIWVAPVKDGRPTAPPRCLTDNKVAAFFPTWSPDGTLIAFAGLKENRSEVWIASADGSTPARAITSSANVSRVRWDPSTGAILVSGTWGKDEFSLRRVSPQEGGTSVPVNPPVIFGSLTSYALFDVSSDGRLLVYSREDIKGNIWVLEAKNRIY